MKKNRKLVLVALGFAFAISVALANSAAASGPDPNLQAAQNFCVQMKAVNPAVDVTACTPVVLQLLGGPAVQPQAPQGANGGADPFSQGPFQKPVSADPSGWGQDDATDFHPYGGKPVQVFIDHEGDAARVTITWSNVVLPPWQPLGACSVRVTQSPKGEWVQSDGASRTFHWLAGGQPPIAEAQKLVSWWVTAKLETEPRVYCGRPGAYTVSWQ